MTDMLVVLGWIMGSLAVVGLIVYGAVRGQMRAETRRRADGGDRDG